MSHIWNRLVDAANNLFGIVPVANGGTGLASGTSGGVPYYSASGTIASSGALTNHAVVVGGGAGATPKTISAGTAGQLLVGATGADPAFGSTVSAVTTFSSGVNLGNTNLTNYTEDDTNTTTFTFNGTGSPGTSGSITLKITRIGRLVTIEIPTVVATTGTSSTVFTSNTAFAAAFRPASTCSFPVFVNNNAASVTQPGLMQIAATGVITIYQTNTLTAYTNTAQAGLDRIATVSFRV